MLSQALFDEDRLSNVKLNLAIIAWNVDRLVEFLTSSSTSRLSSHHRVLHTAGHGSCLSILLLRRILVLLSGPHLIRILVVLLLLIVLLLLVWVVVLLVRIVVLLLLLLAVRILRLIVVLLVVVVPRAEQTRQGLHRS